MKSKNYVYIRLHKKYDISITVILKLKYNQQYVESFRILKKIDRLTYRLKLSVHWRIHFVFFVTQMKSCFNSITNSFNRSRSNHSNFVFVEKDTKKVKFYEIEKLFNKRQTKRRESKYLIRWRDYEFENDDWRNFSKLDDVMNLIRKYEKVIRNITSFFERLKFIDASFSSIVKSKKFFFVVVIRKFFSIETSAAEKFFFVVLFFVVTIRKLFSTATNVKSTTFIFTIVIKQKFVVVISQKSSTITTSITFVVAIRKSFTSSTIRRFIRLLKKKKSKKISIKYIDIKHDLSVQSNNKYQRNVEVFFCWWRNVRRINTEKN